MKILNKIVKENKVIGYTILDEDKEQVIGIQFTKYRKLYNNLKEAGYSVLPNGEIVVDNVNEVDFSSLSLLQKGMISTPPEGDDEMYEKESSEEDYSELEKITIKSPDEIKIKTREELVQMLKDRTTKLQGTEAFRLNQYVDPKALFLPEELDTEIVSLINNYIYSNLIHSSQLKQISEKLGFQNLTQQEAYLAYLKYILEYGIPGINIGTTVHEKIEQKLNVTTGDLSSSSATTDFSYSTCVYNTVDILPEDTVTDNPAFIHVHSKYEVSEKQARLTSTRNAKVSHTCRKQIGVTPEISWYAPNKSSVVISLAGIVLKNEINRTLGVFKLPHLSLFNNIYSPIYAIAGYENFDVSTELFISVKRDSIVEELTDKLTHGTQGISSFNLLCKNDNSPISAVKFIISSLKSSLESVISKKITPATLYRTSPQLVIQEYGEDDEVLKAYVMNLILTDKVDINFKIAKDDEEEEDKSEFQILADEIVQNVCTGKINIGALSTYKEIIDNYFNTTSLVITALLRENVPVSTIYDEIYKATINKVNEPFYITHNGNDLMIQLDVVPNIEEVYKSELAKLVEDRISRTDSFAIIEEVLFEPGAPARHSVVRGRFIGTNPKSGYSNKGQDSARLAFEQFLSNTVFKASQATKNNHLYQALSLYVKDKTAESYTINAIIDFEDPRGKVKVSVPNHIVKALWNSMTPFYETTNVICNHVITPAAYYVTFINATITPYMVIPKKGFDIVCNPLIHRFSYGIDLNEEEYKKRVADGKVIGNNLKSIAKDAYAVSGGRVDDAATLSIFKEVYEYMKEVCSISGNEYANKYFVTHPYDKVDKHFKDQLEVELTDRAKSVADRYLRLSRKGYVLNQNKALIDKATILALPEDEKESAETITRFNNTAVSIFRGESTNLVDLVNKMYGTQKLNYLPLRIVENLTPNQFIRILSNPLPKEKAVTVSGSRIYVGQDNIISLSKIDLAEKEYEFIQHLFNEYYVVHTLTGVFCVKLVTQ